MDRSSREISPRVLRWTYAAKADEVSLVLPDGCVDILVSCRGGTASVGVTDWDFAPRQVKIPAGTSLIGYRLQPGTTIRLDDVAIVGRDLSDLDAAIADAARHDREIAEIINALNLPGGGIERLARQQGVSERTLQRHFKSLSLPPPAFWRQLGRARRAVQALSSPTPLPDIALDYGYSDQAHMTREFRRWFGRTPAQLRRAPAAMNDLAQPGLGNWSGVLEPAGLS